MRRWITVWVVVLLAGIVAVGAQEPRSDGDVLAYGEVVDGVITNAVFEVSYPFEGEEGDVLLLEVRVTDEDSSLDWPEVTLVGVGNETIADSNAFVSINRSVVAARLPYTGNYEVLVSRDDGRQGEGEGPFALRVLRPVPLQPGVTVEGRAENNEMLNYYSVQQPGFFSVYYEFAGGDLDPYIDAYEVDTGNGGELVSLATLRGQGLRNGSVGVDGATSDIHIFTVGDSEFAFYFDNRTETADYRLRLLTND